MKDVNQENFFSKEERRWIDITEFFKDKKNIKNITNRPIVFALRNYQTDIQVFIDKKDVYTFHKKNEDTTDMGTLIISPKLTLRIKGDADSYYLLADNEIANILERKYAKEIR